MIRPIKISDAQAVCDIYNYYIENTVISFEYEKVSLDDMQARISSTIDKYPWLVYEEQGEVVAFVYASLWKTRKAYQHTLESTVYASHKMKTKGVGTKLYEALFDDLENDSSASLNKSRVKALMAVIALPNEASIALHKKMGFTEAGLFKSVGYKFDQWVDVAYYQKAM